MKTMAIHRNKKDLIEIHFQINQNRFGDSARHRITNGIKVRHKLEALCVSGLHEFVHCLIYSYCGDKQGHNATFLNINHKIHGSDPNIFEYRDENPAETQLPAA